MIINCPEDLKATEENYIKIEEDDIDFYVDTIELCEDNAIFCGSAVIEDEKYNGFTVEVTFVKFPTSKDFLDILKEEWDFYDLIF
ncbi:MAG: hypothetical protein ACK5LY_08875 [Lachnospirales bacterium]